MGRQKRFNVFEVKCSDKEYRQICEPRLTKEFFDECLTTTQKLKNRNVKEKSLE